MDWKDKLLIMGSLLVVIGWVEAMHRNEMDKMDERWKTFRTEDQERWKWLFERMDNKLDKVIGKS